MSNPQHPSIELLERYSLGQVSGNELPQIEEHLMVCELCQNELTATEVLIAEIKLGCAEFKRLPVPDRFSFFKRFQISPASLVPVGAFAALALVVVPVSMHQPPQFAPAQVRLETWRGAGEASSARAQAKRPLQLHLNARELEGTVAYRAEIVDSKGTRVWNGVPVRDASELAITVPRGFSAGLYWVRLLNGDTPVQEFGLQLR